MFLYLLNSLFVISTAPLSLGSRATRDKDTLEERRKEEVLTLSSSLNPVLRVAFFLLSAFTLKTSLAAKKFP
jgi:hypothetical protein